MYRQGKGNNGDLILFPAVNTETSNLLLPRHIAIIMDGNGRWATARGLPRTAGHRAGADAVRVTVEECRRLGIAHLTLYAFSSENWCRPAAEVAALFSLLLEFLTKETPAMREQGIALQVLGDMDGLPGPQRAALKHAMAKTADCRAMRLNLALNYGGRAELTRAMRQLAGKPANEITEESIANALYTAGQPDPDLLIRTSGELRLSNFLLWQCAYSELYFTPTLWPDFNAEELARALQAYAGRQRRFGGAGANSTASNPNGAKCHGS